MELLCIDFCGWLWKNKYTVVDVSLMRKYFDCLEKKIRFLIYYLAIEANYEQSLQKFWQKNVQKDTEDVIFER